MKQNTTIRHATKFVVKLCLWCWDTKVTVYSSSVAGQRHLQKHSAVTTWGEVPVLGIHPVLIPSRGKIWGSHAVCHEKAVGVKACDSVKWEDRGGRERIEAGFCGQQKWCLLAWNFRAGIFKLECSNLETPDSVLRNRGMCSETLRLWAQKIRLVSWANQIFRSII